MGYSLSNLPFPYLTFFESVILFDLILPFLIHELAEIFDCDLYFMIKIEFMFCLYNKMYA